MSDERVGEWGLVKKMSVPAHDYKAFRSYKYFSDKNLKLFLYIWLIGPQGYLGRIGPGHKACIHVDNCQD
jgi:hypothetical protein